MSRIDSVEKLLREVKSRYPDIKLNEAKHLTNEISYGEEFVFLCFAKKQNKTKVVSLEKPIAPKRASEVALVLTNKRLYVLNRELSSHIEREILQVHHSSQEEFFVETAIWDRKALGMGDDFKWPLEADFFVINERDSSQLSTILETDF